MKTSVGRERQQRGDARALDRVLELALMQRAGAGDAARKDLPALRDELLQHLHVFVVDVLELLDAELADALAAIEELLLATLRAAGAGRTSAAFRSSSTSCSRSHVWFSFSRLRLRVVSAGGRSSGFRFSGRRGRG